MSADRKVIWPMPDNSWGCFLGGLAFSGVFALAGAGILYLGFVAPYFAIKGSQTWVETPCQILESKVTHGYGDRRGSGRGSYDYALEIQYRYAYDGKEYVSDRYSVSSAADTKEGWRREVVQASPKGSKTVCYVNPGNPEEAVLSREFHASRRAIILPVALLLIGLIGIASVLAASVPDKETSARSRQ